MKTTTITLLVGTILAASGLGAYLYTRPEPAPLTLTGPCGGIKGDNNCAPLIGCIANSDIHFSGRSNGWIKGEIVGVLSNGAACNGRWSANPAQSGGSGQASCDDGTEFSVKLHKYDRGQWIVIGHGQTTAGQTIYAISSSPAFRRNQIPLKQSIMMNICQSLLAKDQ